MKLLDFSAGIIVGVIICIALTIFTAPPFYAIEASGGDCIQERVELLDKIYSYNATTGLTCLPRAILAKEALSKVGIPVEIKIGAVQEKTQGHAWIEINGVEYWRGTESWNTSYYTLSSQKRLIQSALEEMGK
jgi:hypothetical protein